MSGRRIVSPPITAAFMAAQGAVLLAAPARFYSSDTFAVAFDLVGQRAWGVAFLASGLIFLATRAHVALGLVVFVLVCWAAALGAAVLTGDAESPAPFIWPACVATILVTATGRWGAGARR